MPFVTPATPSLVDFKTFLAESVQIPVEALPVDSPWPGYAFDQAMILTPAAGVGVLYSLAVYNGATAILFMITPDQNGQTYFADARGNGPTGFGLIVPSTGLIAASSDQGTSATLVPPRWADGLTVGQLEFYKTPWGRAYLSYLQSYGETIVGLT